MKIAFYTPSLNLGGYERVVMNYANALSAHHKVTVLCGKAEGSLMQDVSEHIHLVDFKVRARGFIPALTRWLKHNSVDILYVPFVTFTCMAVVSKYLAGSNVIIYGAQHGFEERKNQFVEKVVGRIVQKADVLTAVSNSVANYDSSRLGIKRERYYVLDNPVFASNEAFNSLVPTEKGDELVLVTSGRLAKDKHLEIPIRITKEILKETQAKLVVLGDGPDKPRLKALAEKLNIADSVVFKGYVQNPMEHILRGHILFQTSRKESFGNAVVEALACGVPVICTNCGGPVEIIEGDVYGISIGKYDDPLIIQEGVAAIREVLKREYDFHKLQEKANRYIATNLIDQFLEPYYECIKKD